MHANLLIEQKVFLILHLLNEFSLMAIRLIQYGSNAEKKSSALVKCHWPSSGFFSAMTNRFNFKAFQEIASIFKLISNLFWKCKFSLFSTRWWCTARCSGTGDDVSYGKRVLNHCKLQVLTVEEVSEEEEGSGALCRGCSTSLSAVLLSAQARAQVHWVHQIPATHDVFGTSWGKAAFISIIAPSKYTEENKNLIPLFNVALMNRTDLLIRGVSLFSSSNLGTFLLLHSNIIRT